MSDPTRLVPDASGSFAQVRQPEPNPGIRPPATLRQVDGRAGNTAVPVVIDPGKLAEIQAAPRPSMRNPHPR
jgi:hypothetical protein